MKKDNLVSIGLIINKKFRLDLLMMLHEYLSDNYNYFEIILLNYDISDAQYKSILENLNNIRIIELLSYIDIEIAYSTIIENCIGDNLAIIDLEHDGLNDLMNMLEKSEEFDVVVGKRKEKKNTFFENFLSKIFYQMLNLFTGIKIDTMYSDFFVINRKVIHFIIKNKDRVKYIKLLKFNNGFTKYEYEYMPIGKKSNRRTFLENINFTLDIIVNYSQRLIRFATIISLGMAIFNLVYILYVISIYFFKSNIIQGWVSLSLYESLISFALFLVLAIIGEYIRIILLNQKQISLYEIVNEQSSVTLFSYKKNVDKE